MSGKIWRLHYADKPVRGAFVQLGAQWAELCRERGYAGAQAQLLGQTLAAVPLLMNHLKHAARLTLQVSQAHPIRLLVAQGDPELNLRGMLQVDTPLDQAPSPNGRLAVTLEPRDGTQRFQGLVSLDGAGVGAWLEHYFGQSEQIRSRFVLVADEERAGGLFLQQMPGEDAGDWTAAIDALDIDILPDEPGGWLPALLGEDISVSPESQAVQLKCQCNADKVAGVLLSMGEQELRDVLAEQGEVGVDCGFCGKHYAYDAQAVEGLLAVGSMSDDAVRH